MTDQPITAGDIAVSPDLDPAGHRPSREEIAAAVETSEEMNAADETYAAELAAAGDAPTPPSDEQQTFPAEDLPLAEDGADDIAPPPYDVPETGPEVAAEATEQIAPPGEDVAAEPEDVAAEPEDVAAEPEDVAAEPEDVAAQPEDVAAEPEDVAAEPTEDVPAAVQADDDAVVVALAVDPEPESEPEAAADADVEPVVATPESADTDFADTATADTSTADAESPVASETGPADSPAAVVASEAEPAADAPEPAASASAPAPSPPLAPTSPARPDAGHGRPRPGGPGPRPGGGRPSPIPRHPHPPGTTHPPTLPLVPDPLGEASDPTPWGRVDPDGTVFVFAADGERAVGFWQAGDATAGLAHYGRRFDDFVTEIVVLETRVANHAGDLKATRSHAAMLRQSIDTLPAVGDLAAAAARLDAVVAAAEEAMSAVAQDRATARAEALARREALCTEAEQIAESSQWKTSGDRLKEIVEEWRTIRGLDRRTDDQLWKRFSKARDTFIRRRGSHFADLDKERAAVREVKDKLIARAEELADSSDWAETASKYRDLMAEWKAAGRTSRDLEDALWMRFRDAQERFFSRRQQSFASRDAEFEANATAREALLAEAEKINPNTDLDAAKAALRSVQARWEDTGKVPRERIRSLDGRLRAVEDRVKSAEDSHWRRTDPEATARLAQFRTRYETYQAQADKAKAAGDSRRAAAAQAQADQWLEWLKAAESAVE